MIDTKFEAYCEECTELDPIVNKIYADNKIASQIITCEHIKRCERMYDIIKTRERIRDKFVLTREEVEALLDGKTLGDPDFEEYGTFITMEDEKGE